MADIDLDAIKARCEAVKRRFGIVSRSEEYAEPCRLADDALALIARVEELERERKALLDGGVDNVMEMAERLKAAEAERDKLAALVRETYMMRRADFMRYQQGPGPWMWPTAIKMVAAHFGVEPGEELPSCE